MKKVTGQISDYGVRLALRHPLRTARMGNVLVGSTVRLVVIGRQGAEAAKRAATDRAVHAEGRRAVASATRAARRIHRVGFGNALSDRRAVRELWLATGHASKAANLVFNPRPSRPKRTVVIVVGAGATAGAAYAAWKLYATPSRATETNDFTVSNAASPVTPSPLGTAAEAADAPKTSGTEEHATDTEEKS